LREKSSISPVVAPGDIITSCSALNIIYYLIKRKTITCTNPNIQPSFNAVLHVFFHLKFLLYYNKYKETFAIITSIRKNL